MEIRTIHAAERLAVAELLDRWPLAEGWSAGARFRKQIEFDPRYRDENVWLATEQGEIGAVLTAFPRELKILGHSVPTAGFGNLYTSEKRRGRGIMTQLLDRACEEMRTRGSELSILFPGAPPATPSFFKKRGWHSWNGQSAILRLDPTSTAPAFVGSEDIELAPVEAGQTRALQSVKAIRKAYGATRSGTVERDDALWQACLDLKPAPKEEFWIARRGGLTVAYARAAMVDDVLTLTEIGRFEEGAAALAKLISSLLTPRAPGTPDPLAREGLASSDLRSFVVLPTFDDIGLMVALEQRGIGSHPMNDAGALFRCVNLVGFAARLDVDVLPGEDGPQFLQRILPPDGMVFWPADRF